MRWYSLKKWKLFQNLTFSAGISVAFFSTIFQKNPSCRIYTPYRSSLPGFSIHRRLPWPIAGIEFYENTVDMSVAYILTRVFLLGKPSQDDQNNPDIFCPYSFPSFSHLFIFPIHPGDVPLVSKTEITVVADNDVLMNSDVNGPACKNQATRDSHIISGGFWIAGRMIVSKNNGRSLMIKGRKNNFSRIYGAGRQAPFKKRF